MGRLSPADFHTVYGFRRPEVTLLESSRQVCGLDYPFTLPRKLRSLGAARLVSTPSRLVSLRAWLGIAISGFPEFEQFCIADFPASTQVFLKSAAYAIPPRPRAAVRLPFYHRSGLLGRHARFLVSRTPLPLSPPTLCPNSVRRLERIPKSSASYEGIALAPEPQEPEPRFLA